MKILFTTIFGILIISISSFLALSAWVPQLAIKKETDNHIAFVMEAYKSIQENYWKVLGDDTLSNLFERASEHITNKEFTLGTTTPQEVGTMVRIYIQNFEPDAKKEFVTLLVHTVLQSLEPAGRSALYTQKEETAMRDRVANVNKNSNLYSLLDIPEESDAEVVTLAYEEKKEQLERKKSTPEIQKKLEEIAYAKDVLINWESKKIYDEKKIEPTVFTDIITPEIAYIRINKFSPTTFDDFIRTADTLPEENLNTLILDLRGNVGGSIDLLQWFLGPFIGYNQYAYEFFHQEEYTPFKTQTGWLPSLVKYKRVVILIDSHVQSSAEVMVATLQKYNVGVLVGTKTRGWGTVENTYPIETVIDEDEKYSLFLVNSITLRPDGQPIEGRGVDPTIDINNPNWKEEFSVYFNDKEFLEVVARLVN